MSRPLLVTVLLLTSLAQAGTLTLKGSDTMVVLNQRWAEAFMKKHPETKVQVTGGGSGTGLAALQNGSTDIAASSRLIKEGENQKLKSSTGALAQQTAVAKDGVAFYVNDKNPAKSLTMEQLAGIYMGDTTQWSQLGGFSQPIVAYSRENSSGTYVFVKEVLLKEEDFADNVQTLPGTSAVVNAVAKQVNGIGYGGAAYAKGVKELSIKVGDKEIAPTAPNVKSGVYPLARDLYFYTRAKQSPDVKAFVDFCLSAEGQQIVSAVGYYPLK